VLPVFIAGAPARSPNSPVFGLSRSSVHNHPLISCSSPLAMMLNSLVIIPADDPRQRFSKQRIRE
jgi:hypothetical protein